MKSENCLLKNICIKKDTVECNNLCSSKIYFYGLTDKTGKSRTAQIPTDFNAITLNDLHKLKINNRNIYNMLVEYVKTFKRFKQKDLTRNKINFVKNLYLFSSNVGTGKTSTATALLNEYLIYNYIYCLNNNVELNNDDALFIDMNELQTLYSTITRNNVSSEIQNNASIKYYNLLERAKKVDLLVLDDISLRSITEAFRMDLHSIINYRTINYKTTIYTANVDMQELNNLLSKQLFDRIKLNTVEIHFAGASLREGI